MPSSSLFLRSSATLVVALSLLTSSNAYTSDLYELDTTYAGDTFFDGFDFFTAADPSHGFVTYVDEDTAKNTGLIKFADDGSVIIGVDSTHTYNASGAGRPSVRITSTKKYNHGLFIADISHMPGGVCGTWPAFWTLGDGVWPYHGEIDILEGANDQTTDLSSLHTAGTCSIAGDRETGILQATDCTYDVNTGNNSEGCGVENTNSNSYGLGFNSDNGGVYAMQWTSDYIRIWFWPRASIPSDIEAGKPNPYTWGPPTSNFQGSCDIDSNFLNQQIVLDVTFCGDVAGGTWNSSCAAKTGVSTCAAYVANNPSAFADMYWDINSIKVYQLAPPSSTLITIGTPISTPYSTTASSTTTTGTLSYNTASGAWSAWSSDAVTYGGSSTPSAPLTTGSAQYSLLLPPMGWSGNAGGTISAGGTVYTWGSATLTDQASKTTTTAQNYSPTGTGASASHQTAGPSAYGTQAAAFTGAAAVSSASVSIMGTVVMAVVGLVVML